MSKKIPSLDLNYNVKDIFPISIHQFKINNFDDIKDKLIDYTYDAKKKDSVGAIISNCGGWQSSPIDFSKDDDFFCNCLFDCLSELPFLKNERVDYKIDAWININKKGDYNIKHNHPTSDLSGVLWIKCPEKCGEIVFTSPYNFVGFKEHELYSDKFQKEHSAYLAYNFQPKEGFLLLFPSHLEHRVNENQSDEDRISVAFNMRFE